MTLNMFLCMLWMASILNQIYTCYVAYVQENYIFIIAHVYFFIFHTIVLGDTSDDSNTTPCSCIQNLYKGLMAPFTDKYASTKVRLRHYQMDIRIVPLETYTINIAIRWFVIAVILKDYYYTNYPYQFGIYIDILICFSVIFLTEKRDNTMINLVISCWSMIDIFNLYLICMSLSWWILPILSYYILSLVVIFILLKYDLRDEEYTNILDIVAYTIFRHRSSLHLLYKDHTRPNFTPDEVYLRRLYHTINDPNSIIDTSILDGVAALEAQGIITTNKGSIVHDLLYNQYTTYRYTGYMMVCILAANYMLVTMYFQSLANIHLPKLALGFYYIFMLVGGMTLILCKSYFNFKYATRGLRRLG